MIRIASAIFSPVKNKATTGKNNGTAKNMSLSMARSEAILAFQKITSCED